MTFDGVDEERKLRTALASILELDLTRLPPGNTEKFYKIMDPNLSYDLYTFIIRQLNEVARLGKINDKEKNIMVEAACEGLFNLVYLKHYKPAKKVIREYEFVDTNTNTQQKIYKEEWEFECVMDKDPVFLSARNLIWMLFTRVQNGHDALLFIEELRSKQVINNVIGRS